MIIALILSVVQALSEFLPISSSAHLLIIPWLFHWPDYGLSFDAAIHLGTALALVAYFWRDLWKMARRRDRILWYILIATIPGATIGLLGEKWIDDHLHEASYAPLVVGIGMILFALLLWVVDSKAPHEREMKSMSLMDAVWVGIAQTLALIPGVSRSGASITAGRALKLTREESARFSFLLAIPITIGAGGYSTLKMLHESHHAVSNTVLIVSIIVTAVAGWAVIKWLLGYLTRHSLSIFVWYRILLAVLIIGVWLARR